MPSHRSERSKRSELKRAMAPVIRERMLLTVSGRWPLLLTVVAALIPFGAVNPIPLYFAGMMQGAVLPLPRWSPSRTGRFSQPCDLRLGVLSAFRHSWPCMCSTFRTIPWPIRSGAQHAIWSRSMEAPSPWHRRKSMSLAGVCAPDCDLRLGIEPISG